MDEIKQEFMSGSIDYIDAVTKLEAIGYGSFAAERKVCEWELDREQPTGDGA